MIDQARRAFNTPSLKVQLFLLASLLVSDSAIAQAIPHLLDVPTCLPEETRSRLVVEHDGLLQQRNALRERVLSHNNACTNVPENSQISADCNRAKSALDSAKAEHIARSNEFNLKIEHEQSSSPDIRVTFDPASVDLLRGQTQTMTASIRPASAAGQVKFSVADPRVTLTVGQPGLATVAALGPGIVLSEADDATQVHIKVTDNTSPSAPGSGPDKLAIQAKAGTCPLASGFVYLKTGMQEAWDKLKTLLADQIDKQEGKLPGYCAHTAGSQLVDEVRRLASNDLSNPLDEAKLQDLRRSTADRFLPVCQEAASFVTGISYNDVIGGRAPSVLRSAAPVNPYPTIAIDSITGIRVHSLISDPVTLRKFESMLTPTVEYEPLPGGDLYARIRVGFTSRGSLDSAFLSLSWKFGKPDSSK